MITKISNKPNLQEEKPALVHQCIVNNFKCNLCDADYIGYTIPDLTKMFSYYQTNNTPAFLFFCLAIHLQMSIDQVKLTLLR